GVDPADGEGGRLRAPEAAVDGAAARASRVPCHHRAGGQSRAREPVARQGRAGAGARAPAARARHRDESPRSSARRGAGAIRRAGARGARRATTRRPPGGSPPRGTRPGTTSAPASSSSSAARRNNGTSRRDQTGAPQRGTVGEKRSLRGPPSDEEGTSHGRV